jgi:hypothetical protein
MHGIIVYVRVERNATVLIFTMCCCLIKMHDINCPMETNTPAQSAALN